MGESINLVNNFKVEKVIFNCGPYNYLEKKLLKNIKKRINNIFKITFNINVIFFCNMKKRFND